MKTFQQLFERYAGTILARQFRFGEILKEHHWRLKLNEATIVFNDEQEYAVQLLGTTSDPEEEWLWCWADETLTIAETALTFSERMRALGEKEGIAELYKPRFQITPEIDGHKMSMLCAGLEGKSCYFHGPYTGGAIYCLIQGLPEEIFSLYTMEVLSLMIWRVVTTYEEADHKALLTHFLSDQEFVLEDNGDTMKALRGSDKIDMGFSDENRLIRMEI
ncbi:MAG: hypothetical protein LBV45_00855 [Xanthomonadaceae bacterium]|nr:hypothetical protein [Xanthomonadaceae bacterium]